MMRGLSSPPLCTCTRGVTHEWDSLLADPSEGPSVHTGMLPKEARQDGAEIGLLPDISGSNRRSFGTTVQHPQLARSLYLLGRPKDGGGVPEKDRRRRIMGDITRVERGRGDDTRPDNIAASVDSTPAFGSLSVGIIEIDRIIEKARRHN